MSSVRSRSRSSLGARVTSNLTSRVAPLRRLSSRALIALTAAALLSVVLAAPAPAANDPRGINRTYEAPGTAQDPNAPVVALTFDDGPSQYTPAILDILKQYGVQATFFEIGRQVEARADVVRRIVAEGHVLGNHTWDHAHLTKLDDARFASEVDQTTQVIERVSGQEVVCTRPPYGDANAATIAKLAAHGQTSVVWSADSRDFEKPGVAAIVHNALSGLRPGAIILMHDGGGDRSETIAALPQIIQQIRAKGYGFVTACDKRVHKPSGHLDAVASNQAETLTAAGWATDPDTSDPITVQVTLDGKPVAEARADRPHPGTGDGHGFSVDLPVASGEHEVCVIARNAGLGHTDVQLGCAKATPLPAPWYDRLGRALGLLGKSERWELPAPPLPAPADQALQGLIDTLLPAP
jgi:peptidoglycan/xylan/chitin deacetylase (PgdA/CDA1 family)